MRVLAIAGNTYRESVRQPVFFVIMAAGAALVFLSQFFALFCFGEEMKLIKDMGLATITVSALLQTLFVSSTVVWAEIEKRTALTVLSKPVRRGSFIVGKFLGILGAVFLSVAVLGLVLLLTCYMAEAGTAVDHEHHTSHSHCEVEHSLPIAAFAHDTAAPLAKGIFLIYVQVAVICAISVAVSARFPMALNFMICLAVFVLGNLSQYIHDLLVNVIGQSQVGLRVAGTLLYAVLPNLSNFNLNAPLAMGHSVSLAYMGAATLYGLGYIVVALLFAMLLFRGREIA